MNRTTSWRNDLVFDHAFVLVNDLEEADARMRTEYGLESVAGGTFPNHAGLANRFVPMVEGYLELLAPTDHEPARGEAAEFWAERLSLYGEHIGGWALRTDRLNEAATDLGLDIDGPERAALEEAPFEERWSVIWPEEDPPSMPFLIQYESFESLRALMDRGLAKVEHEHHPLRVEALEIGGNLQQIAARISSPVPLHVGPGPDRVMALVIATRDGSVELRWE